MRFFSLLILGMLVLSSCAQMRYARNESAYNSLKFSPSDTSISNSFTDDYLSQFIQEVCSGKNDESCKNKKLTTLQARLSQKYIGALPEAVRKTCEAYPVECRNSYYLEKIYIGLHNRSVDHFVKFHTKSSRDVFNDKSIKDAWTIFMIPSSGQSIPEQSAEYSRPISLLHLDKY